MKISLKVSLIASVIVLGSFASFSFFQYKDAEKNLMRQIAIGIDETTISLDYQISNWLNAKLSMVNTLAELIASHDKSDRKYQKKIVSIEEGRSVFQLLYFTDSVKGKSIFNDASIVVEDENSLTRPWYKLAVNSSYATALLTEPYIDNVTDNPMISAVAKVVPKGSSEEIGVVGGDIDIRVASDALNQINFHGAGYTFIANKAGKLIIHPDSELFDKKIDSIFANSADIDMSKTGLQNLVSIDGKELAVQFRPMQGVINSDWVLGAVIKKDLAHRGIDRMMKIALIGSLIATVICTLLIYLFMNSAIIKPIVTLTQNAIDVSMGKMSQPVDEKYMSRKDEIGRLAEGFERMRKSLGIAFSKISKIHKG